MQNCKYKMLLNDEEKDGPQPSTGHFWRTDVFSCWIYPLLQSAFQHPIQLEQLSFISDHRPIAQYTRKIAQLFFHQTTPSKHQLANVLFTVFRTQLLIYFFLSLLIALSSIATPYIIKLILQRKEAEHSAEATLDLLALLILVKLVIIILTNKNKFIMRKLGYEAQMAITALLTQKSLRISFLSNPSYTSGKVINLMQADATKISYVTFYIGYLVISPIQFVASIFLIINEIGLQFLPGLIVLFVAGIANTYLGRLIQRRQKAILDHKDQRINYTNSLFQAIKFIKINAQEDYFQHKLNQLRLLELKAMKSKQIVQGLCIFSAWAAPIFILLSTFLTITFCGEELTAPKAFLIIGLTFMIQQPVIQFPQAFSEVQTTMVSVTRIQEFLHTQELQDQCLNFINSNDCSVPILTLFDCCFHWPTAEVSNGSPQQGFQLKDIELSLFGNQFVAIYGDVGSGKSSLLYSVLGEMLYDQAGKKPKIDIYGKVAYVGQRPWIFNDSVKENILFGKELDPERYKDAIHFSCLEVDIKNWQFGDETMIGEKGVNLSGGQKARIALARAIYSDADIYLFDDLISAVDVYVGSFIIEKCIKQFLDGKLRLLVTHNIKYTQLADQIYHMQSGVLTKQLQQAVFKNQCSIEDNFQQFIDNKPPPEESNQSSENAKDNLIISEQLSQQGLKENVYSSYFKANGGFRTLLAIIFVQGGWVCCYVCSNITLACWSQEQTGQTIENHEAYFYLKLYFTFSLVQALLTFFRPFTLVQSSIVLAQNIHNNMIRYLAQNRHRSLLNAPINTFFDRTPTGRIINRLTNDLNTLDQEIVWSLNWSLSQISLLTTSLVIQIYSSHYIVILPVLLYFALCKKIQNIYIQGSRELQRLDSICKSPIVSQYTEIISNGLSTIRAYRAQQQVMETCFNKIETHRQVFMASNAATNWFMIMLGIASFILNTLIIIYCVYFLDQPAAKIGLLLTFATSLDQYISDGTQAISKFQLNLVGFERCLEYSKLAPEQETTDNLEPDQWPKEGAISFKNYTARYRKDLKPALQNFSLTIKPMEKIGIVGRTGAGKSTLTLSLLRIIETVEGIIEIDDVDISSLNLLQLRSNITMIMQDAHLFTGTLQENLDPYGEHEQSDILRIINSCCLQDFFSERGGFSAYIADGGKNISEGEKQLICIARAALKRTKIVLIDEATSNIDAETEKKVQLAIKESFKNCTVMTIAHRISTILHCDKILVVDAGSVAEFDSTSNLIQREDSLFFKIYQEAVVKGTF